MKLLISCLLVFVFAVVGVVTNNLPDVFIKRNPRAHFAVVGVVANNLRVSLLDEMRVHFPTVAAKLLIRYI